MQINLYYVSFIPSFSMDCIVSHAGNCVMLNLKARMLDINWSPSLRCKRTIWNDDPMRPPKKIGIKSIQNIIYLKTEKLIFSQKFVSSSSYSTREQTWN